LPRPEELVRQWAATQFLFSDERVPPADYVSCRSGSSAVERQPRDEDVYRQQAASALIPKHPFLKAFDRPSSRRPVSLAKWYRLWVPLGYHLGTA